ncbi:MAG: DEAD/DEAH box helicase, partial [Cellulosilyticaceae bacterium]
MKKYARVIIQFAKVGAIDRLFTYEIPGILVERVQVGERVKVPFGPRNTPQLAYVLEVLDTNPDEGSGYRIKKLLAVVDDAPILSTEQLGLAQYLVQYYGAAWAAAIDTVLPPGLTEKAVAYEPQSLKVVKLYPDVSRVQSYMAQHSHKKTFDKQKAILLGLEPSGEALLKMLLEQGISKSALQTLQKNGIVSVEEQIKEIHLDPIHQDAFKVLSDEQAYAHQQILTCLEGDVAQTILLQGVTGSGKTEVFLYAIKDVLERGGSAIVLVPEIALTKQTLD